MISIQQQDFSLADEYANLNTPGETGAIVTFVGRVRDFSDCGGGLYLQHFPGMAEKALQRIADQANKRWALQKLRIIHRVGRLATNEQIVLVGVASAHRAEAFAACEFIIDILKTQAPFWKKEGDTWLEAKASDSEAADHWLAEKTGEQ
ncbi:MAG: molybdenum cofactor biosynthesis protein MoaE [Cellvibrionaceae bacterium]|nr:molybdenum cofactor biosynthesis protein MoaE [Cellvibrionaceae bacterium]